MPIRQLRQKNKSGFYTHKIGETGNITKRAVGAKPQITRSGFNEPNEHYVTPSWRARRKGALLNSGNFWTLFRRSLPTILIIFFLGGIFFVGAIAWYSRDLPDPNKIIDRSLAQSTKIYDRTGEHLLYEIHGDQRRTVIELKDIPQYAIDATIAVEDKNFFKHSGISLWGIIRGQIVPRLQGKRAQGGSTLTQQFVKNAILTNERSFSRKFREWILSYRLEQKSTKEEILKLYFNEIPYGTTAYGIESASGIYFGKSAKDLTLAEAAILAALPQAPSYYSPYGPNKDALMERQKVVLNLMVDQGYITRQQADQAGAEQVAFKKKREDITAPHFVFMVQNELAEKYGDRLVEQGGLIITTTLDWDKQKLAEETINEQADGIQERYNAGNASLVSIDVASGDVLALVGSKDFFNDDIDGQVNVAISPRQPGSSLKPFVYAAAFAKGFNPKTILFDLVTSFSAGGDPYTPHNYDLKEHGPVSMRQALAGSLNIPAVKTLYLAGVDNVIKLTQELGYTTLIDPNRYGLSLVLGGGEVKLIEHVNAYASLARDGVYEKYYTVLKVVDANGKVLEEKEEPKEKRVLDKQVAREVTDILTDNSARAYIFGENNYLTLGGRPVAAKTGTTNDYHDAWTMGYTPQIATGVWVGNSDNTEMNRGADGSVVAAPIWNAYMRKILAIYPANGFPKPEEINCDKPMVCGQLAVEEKIRIDKKTGQRATEFTPAEDIEEKTYREVHNILHYVDKNDPLGSIPEDPTKDPQYTLWETAVTKWAEAQGYLDELPPAQDDQQHTAENQPTIEWRQPQNGQTISDNKITLRVQTSSKRGVVKVDYYLDNQFLGTATQSPFDLTVDAKPNWQNGQYTLRATAYDDVNNSKTASININLDITRVDLNIKTTWVAPVNNENYTLANFPKELKINIDKIADIKKVDFYYIFNDQSNWIAYQENLKSNNLNQAWSPTKGAGVYKFYLIITDAFGRVSATDEIVVNIH